MDTAGAGVNILVLFTLFYQFSLAFQSILLASGF